MTMEGGLSISGVYRGKSTYEGKNSSGNFYKQEILQFENISLNGSIILNRVKVGRKSAFDYESLVVDSFCTVPIFVLGNVGKNGQVFINYYLS